MTGWTQYDDHNSGDIEYDRSQTMTAQTRPQTTDTKHPIRVKVTRPWCERSTCVGCRYARVTGCAKSQ